MPLEELDSSTRCSPFFFVYPSSIKMASRCDFEGSNDAGCFATLTNAYAITALGAAENFYRQAEAVAAVARSRG